MKYIKNLNRENFEFKDFNDSFWLNDLIYRWRVESDDTCNIVKNIEKNILEFWDKYSKELTLKFDWVKVDNFLVEKSEIIKSEDNISNELKEAINLAYKNIYTFHERQVPTNLEFSETSKWVSCSKEFRAIEKLWLYIPWWTAPLFSTVLMLAIPAIIAWCKEIYLCTPPNIAPEILYVAKLVGITNIYKIWWAQAIFSMAYWTEQIPKVDKIFGPWNSFVTTAKMIVSSKVAIDMPAWPSEVLVIADKYANSSFAAADLLSQAEHGTDSQVVLVSDDEDKIVDILKEVKQQLSYLDRKDIILKSLENSFSILASSIEEALFISNIYAPEHLILQINNANKYLKNIQNAGSVFIWKYSCESAGDYASWTNHTLPTSWYAKSYSWVSVESFWKWITFQELSEGWINSIWRAVEIMAESEWLFAHKNAMTLRIKSLDK